MREHKMLEEVVSGAWQAFRNPAAVPARVSSAIPILFFGDLDSYLSSEIRVLTVGLNPSLHEFPAESPFRRFPRAKGISPDEQDQYLAALSEYFRVEPYGSWFSAFEPMLNGMGTSYYHGHMSRALHTDICSPVATEPTWNGLQSDIRRALEEDGTPLWHSLLNELRSQLVVLSVAKRHLSRIQFGPLTAWQDVHVFEKTRTGARRARPVKLSAQWREINGSPSLFVFVPAAQTPLGPLGKAQKLEAGTIALEVFHHGR